MPSTLYWISTSSTDPSVGANWSTGSAPTTGDTVFVVPIRGLTLAAIGAFNHSAVTLAAMTISSGFTATIGTTTADWQISATALNLHTPLEGGSFGTGSGRIKIDLGSVTSTINVYGSAPNPSETGQSPIRLKGTSASNKLYLIGNGKVGFATDAPGDVSTLSEFDVSGQSASLTLGSGCTLTTGNQSAGTVIINSALTTFTQVGGIATTQGSGAITTVTAGGVFNSNSTGTVTTLNVTGKADFSGSPAARTVTTLKAYKGCTINLDNGNKGSVTLTNGIALQNCRSADITLTTWVNNSLALS